MAKKPARPVVKCNELPILGTTEVAVLLGWDRRKVAVYYSRGLLPDPYAVLACGPIWQRRDIEHFIESKLIIDPMSDI